MRILLGRVSIVLACSISTVLVGCRDIQNVVADVTASAKPAPTSDRVESCDPAYSLSGFFDNRPEILIEKPAKYPQAGELKRVAVVAPEGGRRRSFRR